MINVTILAEQNLAEGITEKFERIFPSWPTMLATIIAALILLIVMTKFLYNPIKNMVSERKNYIQNNIDKSIAANVEADKNKDEAQKLLMNTNSEITSLFDNAKNEANVFKQDEISKAKHEAKEILEAARKQIEYERASFLAKAKEEVVDIALQAAHKIIEKEVDNSTNRKIIEDFVKGVKDDK